MRQDAFNHLIAIVDMSPPRPYRCFWGVLPVRCLYRMRQLPFQGCRLHPEAEQFQRLQVVP